VSDMPETQSVSDAMAIEEIAADWAQRRHFWNWTEQNQAELDAWLAKSLAHRVAFMRLDATLQRGKRLIALKTPPAPDPTDHRIRRVRVGIAAALVALVLVGAAAVNALRGVPTENFATAIGERETVTLADGSQIDLNTDTQLRVDARADRPRVWLDRGEAYFRVKHDKVRPLVVIAGDQRIVDLGTEFLVRRDQDRFQIAVAQGRVSYEASKAVAGTGPLTLTEGDYLTADGRSVSLAKKSPHELTNVLGWRRGVIVFDGTTLADAVAEFNRYNRKKLVIANMAAARLTIDGTFSSDSLEGFTDVVRHVLQLRVEDRGDTVVISR
jgi:transmembrane sensor